MSLSEASKIVSLIARGYSTIQGISLTFEVKILLCSFCVSDSKDSCEEWEEGLSKTGSVAPNLIVVRVTPLRYLLY